MLKQMIVVKRLKRDTRAYNTEIEDRYKIKERRQRENEEAVTVSVTECRVIFHRYFLAL